MATGRRARGKILRRWLAGIVVTLLIGYVLLRQVPLATVLRDWSRIPASIYGGALALTALFVVLRALRFQELSCGPERAWRFVGPAAAYSLACRLLPGGTGDLSLPVFLRPLGIGTGASLGMSLVSRLLDLGWAVLLALALALGMGLLPWKASLPPPLYGVALAFLVLLAAFRLPGVRQHLAGVAGRIHRPGIRKLLVEGRSALEVLDRLSPGRLLVLSAITVLIKLVTAALYFVLAIGLGAGIGFPAILLASVVTSLFLAFPVQGIAGLGTEEAWWTLSLQLVGLPLRQSILLGITFHVMNLLLVAALGLVPLVRQTAKWGKGEIA